MLRHTLEDEEPPPTGQVVDPVHVPDAVSNSAAKGAREGGARQNESYTHASLFGFVLL